MPKTPKHMVVVSGIILLGNNIVLQERKDGWFSSPGGKVEKDESPKQALIRELKEELGISIEEDCLELIHADGVSQPSGRHKIIIAYQVGKFKGKIKNLDSSCKNLHTFDIFQIQDFPKNTTDHVKKCIKIICKQ
jgi:8-oxo-dGTP pyrophosphatase MutT (NUDIX family)